MDPKFVLIVNGRELHNPDDNLFTVVDWSVNQSFVNGPSTFTFKVTEDVYKEITVNDRVVIMLDDTIIIRGIVDTYTQNHSSTNNYRIVGGRDLTGWMSENDALPKTYYNTTDNKIIEDILAQAEDLGFGFFKDKEATFKLASPFTIDEYQVSPGTSFLDVCSAVAQLNNMYFYVSPDGTFLKTAIAGEEGVTVDNIDLGSVGTGYSSSVGGNPRLIAGFKAPAGFTYVGNYGNYGVNYKALGVSEETFHKGIDVHFANRNVSSVYTQNGYVTEVKETYTPGVGYGKYVVVNYSSFCIRYAHLSEIKVKLGQRLVWGETIGTEGSTGCATGNHCDIRVAQYLSSYDAVKPNDFPSLTFKNTNQKGIGITEPAIVIDVDSGSGPYADLEYTEKRDIRNAKSDILIYSSVNSSNSSPIDELKNLQDFVGGPQAIKDLLSVKRTSSKKKKVVQVSPTDGQRPDGLHTDNTFRDEGTVIDFDTNRPGSTFRRRLIVSKSGQTQEQILRYVENLLTQTAPSFSLDLQFKRLVYFPINALIHFTHNYIDSDFVIREVNYSCTTRAQTTSVTLILPNRLA